MLNILLLYIFYIVLLVCKGIHWPEGNAVRGVVVLKGFGAPDLDCWLFYLPNSVIATAVQVVTQLARQKYNSAAELRTTP